MVVQGATALGGRVAYLFPGQGSQQVGMGRELYEHSPAARAVFQSVDEALGTPLTALILGGPAEELTRTVNAQPAILAMSMACLAAMEERLGPQQVPAPSCIAGHSLGEYSALVAAGVLDLPDAARLVSLRGRLMQEASDLRPGGMGAVLGLDELTLEEICRETGTQISNVNAEDQIVIAGERLALARALDLASIRGAKRIITLQVSGAFHSALMEPAVEGMAAALAQVRFRNPRVPIIANCSGRPLTTGSALKQDLVQQLCSCVQWKRSVGYMLRAGASTFYEIGPGKVLSSLVKRISRDAQVMNIGDLATIQAMAGS
ncbi:MAG: ACP S-malonyltransferase [Chloroflexi bacterium]|nr:ACP S-malonyltransferase [Chloroflexota bacterium]